MRKFKEFKEGIVDMFIDMKEEDGDPEDTMYTGWINEAKALECFTDLANMMVRIEYWEASDAIDYGLSVEEV